MSKFIDYLVLILAITAWALTLHYCQYQNRYHLRPERFRPSFWSLKCWKQVVSFVSPHQSSFMSD